MFDESTILAIHRELADRTEELPPPPWTLLGEGLSGTVYDLADGTVLKITRRYGGLGSGEGLHLREVLALTLLDGLATPQVAVPRLLAHGTFEDAYIGSAPPLAGWMRLTRLAGRTLSRDMLYGLPAEARDRLGERIGAAIAEFSEQATLRAREAGSKLGDTIARTLTLARDRLGQPELHAAAEALAMSWARRIEEGPLVFVHGDLNPANIIDMNGPVGFVDFAEAGWSLAEAEFRHIEELGALRDAIFRGYTARRGAGPELAVWRLAGGVNALGAIAIHGSAGHPRDAMRRMGLLRHCMEEAGLA